MPTLVIHAPNWRVKGGGRSFEWVMTHGMGYRYAIYKQYLDIIQPDCTVVVIRKDGKRKRAEGQLVNLVPTGIFTKNGIQRYNIHIKNLSEVIYKPEKLNRCGIAVL